MIYWRGAINIWVEVSTVFVLVGWLYFVLRETRKLFIFCRYMRYVVSLIVYIFPCTLILEIPWYFVFRGIVHVSFFIIFAFYLYVVDTYIHLNDIAFICDWAAINFVSYRKILFFPFFYDYFAILSIFKFFLVTSSLSYSRWALLYFM